jgi:hypothetical protein
LAGIRHPLPAYGPPRRPRRDAAGQFRRSVTAADASHAGEPRHAGDRDHGGRAASVQGDVGEWLSTTNAPPRQLSPSVNHANGLAVLEQYRIHAERRFRVTA